MFIWSLLACALAFADVDPRPGSQAALRGLVGSYRNTVVQLFKFEARASDAILAEDRYLDYRNQVLANVLLGLDNVSGEEANKLIAELSAVYLGESAGPLYSCVVQRRAKVLLPYLQKINSMDSWCINNLPHKFCLKNEEADLRLRGSFKKAKNDECDIPLYF